MTRCLLGIGSNLGNRQAMLRQATSSVAGLSGCQLLAHSRWYETAPIGGPTGQGAFLNGALLLECSSLPHKLAGSLHAIETQLGRDRAVRWDARAIDIDLLLFGSELIKTTDLTVPHPRMSFRKFVLEPAAEIAGFLVDPVSGWTLSRLLSHLKSAARYVAVTSASGAIAAWLAEELCQELRCVSLEGKLLAKQVASDSERCETVEYTKKALAAVRKSFWVKDKELLARLPSDRKDPLPISPVVSSFWPNTLLCVAGRSDKPPEIDYPLPSDSVSPALVIAVEPGSEKKFLEKNPRKKFGIESPFLRDVSQSTFHELLEQKCHGPMARIQADDPQVVLQEAIAAIRSIWPELPTASEQESS